MKRIQLRILLVCTVLLAALQMNAQSYLGIQQSNYAGIMGADIQPASIADSRFIFDMNLASFNMTFFNNAKYFDANRMKDETGQKWWTSAFNDTASSWHPSNDTNFYENNVLDLNNKFNKPRGIYFNTQFDVLSFMFSFKKKYALGFSFKVRSVLNFDHIDPALATLAENSLDYTDLHKTDLSDQFLNHGQMTWAEYGINYAQVVLDKKEHFMKVGARLKVLQGFASSYIHTENVDYNLFDKDSASMLQGDFSYGYNSEIDGLFDGTTSIKEMYTKKSRFGMGADIGFVYEWRPDWEDHTYEMDGKKDRWRMDQDKYKIKAGISFVDIGGIKFHKADNSRDFNIDYNVSPSNPSGYYDLNAFDTINSLQEFNTVLDNSSGVTQNPDDEGTYIMQLPTAMHLQFDYNIWKWFYVNVMGTINLHGKKITSHVAVPHQIAITPRFDYAWAGVSVPLSYNEFSGFKAGLGLRLGPITVGVADFKPLFATGKVRGMEFYAGLRIPVLYGKPQDRDGDKVSDKLDECIDVPGVWMFKGCPDTDGDGILDVNDECPTVPGDSIFNGCPDTDKDGIQDALDDCPEVPGDSIFNGCPDTDKDGVMDKDDLCPEVPGDSIFKGCPDRDKDGTQDSEDDCPDLPGPKETKGCPDTDGDGIFDNEDKCIDQPGTRENQGCPWSDQDGDGIKDKDDKCPKVAGPIENGGCPYADTDGDGVIDKEDKCINTPGPADNQGCPKVDEKIEEILKTAFDNLEFFSAKATIKEPSKPSLDELAKVLIEKKDWNLQIAGHTDSDGSSRANLVLSKRRSEAVRDYLASKGIDKSRFTVLYFGESQPLVKNDSPENKQKNRRVEMTIIFK
jgi:outer membrane protein OmpA-like peptidoglycan-associated protein